MAAYLSSKDYDSVSLSEGLCELNANIYLQPWFDDRMQSAFRFYDLLTNIIDVYEVTTRDP